MKPKEYLVSIGELETVGRGRLSLAHIELCKKAAAAGVNIEGYSVSTAVDKDAPVVVTKEKVTNEKVILELAPYRYPEDEYRAYELVDGKKKYRSLREICRHSMVSLVCCPCDAHRIVATDARGDVSVYIERK
jgi:hypothetical protein